MREVRKARIKAYNDPMESETQREWRDQV